MIIFYYTGTGNSLSVAKSIGGELISIPQVMKSKELYFKSDAIGIVFPIYGLEAPKKVQEFISKVKIEADYIFAIGTYGNSPGAAMSNLEKLAEKNDFHFDYLNYLLMVDNCLPIFNIDKQIENLPKKNVEKNLEIIINEIKNKEKKYAKESVLGKIITSVYGAYARRTYTGNEAKKYIVGDNCTRCGTCARGCPAGNIIVSNKVEFKDKCELCQSCIHLCPQNAIHLKNEKNNTRWRNPEVALSEIIKANNQIN